MLMCLNDPAANLNTYTFFDVIEEKFSKPNYSHLFFIFRTTILINFIMFKYVLGYILSVAYCISWAPFPDNIFGVMFN